LWFLPFGDHLAMSFRPPVLAVFWPFFFVVWCAFLGMPRKPRVTEWEHDCFRHSAVAKDGSEQVARGHSELRIFSGDLMMVV